MAISSLGLYAEQKRLSQATLARWQAWQATDRQALLGPNTSQMNAGAGFCYTTLLAKDSQKHG